MAQTIESEPVFCNSDASNQSINYFKKTNFEVMNEFLGSIHFSYLHSLYIKNRVPFCMELGPFCIEM